MTLEQILALADETIEMDKKATSGPWKPCFHLQSEENDKSCPCGFPGDIWGADREHVVCTMGSLVIPGQESMSPPRYERSIEILNGQFIAHSRTSAPELARAVKKMAKMNEVLKQQRDEELDDNCYEPERPFEKTKFEYDQELTKIWEAE